MKNINKTILVVLVALSLFSFSPNLAGAEDQAWYYGGANTTYGPFTSIDSCNKNFSLFKADHQDSIWVLKECYISTVTGGASAVKIYTPVVKTTVWYYTGGIKKYGPFVAESECNTNRLLYKKEDTRSSVGEKCYSGTITGKITSSSNVYKSTGGTGTNSQITVWYYTEGGVMTGINKYGPFETIAACNDNLSLLKKNLPKATTTPCAITNISKSALSSPKTYSPKAVTGTPTTVWYYTGGLKEYGPFKTEDACVTNLSLYKTGLESATGKPTACLSRPYSGAYPIPVGNVYVEAPVSVNLNNPEKKGFEGYKLLAPIPGMETAPENIGDYFNTILLLAIGFCGAMAVVMLIMAGIQYMGEESIFGKTQAKQKITDSVLGLLIALAAFAILNTINPKLLGTESGISIKSAGLKIDPEIHGDTPHSAVNGKYCGQKYPEYTDGARTKWPSDAVERKIVNDAGITVNKDNCSYVGERDCTSLSGLKTASVIALKKKCGAANCELVITGGTECWLHSNKTQHLPGNAIVDLRPTTTLTSYVEANNEKIKSSGMSFPVFVKNITKFMKESDHYHIINW